MSDESMYWDDLPAPVKEMHDNYIRAHGLAVLAVEGAAADGSTLEDLVRALRAERDRLRDAPDDALRKSTQGQFVDLEDEIERLRGTLREVYFHLGPPQPPGHEVGEEGIPALVQKAMAERDRFRAGLKMIAIPPVHVPDLSEGCEGCAGVARAALDGTDYQGRVATTMEGMVAREAVVGAAQRWYEASDMDELQHAVAALKVAVKALNTREGT